MVQGKALIGLVRVSSSYEKLPSTLTQTEPIGQQVPSLGQLEFGDPKVIKKRLNLVKDIKKIKEIGGKC